MSRRVCGAWQRGSFLALVAVGLLVGFAGACVPGPSPAAPQTVALTPTPTLTPGKAAIQTDSDTTPETHAAEPPHDTANMQATGLSAADPVPFGETARLPNWEVQVLQVLQGDPAYQRILADAPETRPAADGMKYIVVLLRVRCRYWDEYAHFVDPGEVAVIGDRRLAQHDQFWDVPAPELVFEDIFPGEELHATLDTIIYSDETNLLLFWNASSHDGGDTARYLALEEGASLPPATDAGAPIENDMGREPDAPAPLGETARTPEWDIRVREVLHGEDALAFVQEILPSNKGADEAMELYAVRVHLRYHGSARIPRQIDLMSFATYDGEETVREAPRFGYQYRDTPPLMIVGFLPGGEFEGWTIVQAPTGSAPMLVFQPDYWSTPRTDLNVRYMDLGQ